MLLHLTPLIITAVISIAIIVERAYSLYWKYPVDANGFMANVKQKVLANDINGAVQVSSSQGKALLPQVVKTGLLRASRDNDQIAASIEIAAHDAIASIRKRIGHLQMLANVATLLGLLGTIFGLIKSFAAVANADAATKSMLLAAGISEAMTATASGLIVAIPVMIAFSILQSKANRMTEQVENAAMSILDLLSARLYRDEFDDLDVKPESPVMAQTGQTKAA